MTHEQQLPTLLVEWEEAEASTGRSIPVEEICPDAPELWEELRLQKQKLDDVNQWIGFDHATVPGVDPEAFPVIEGFEILDVLGRGGMGVVFLAEQQSLNRRVAIKAISAPTGLWGNDLARFRREAESLSRLNHKNIVSIYEFFPDHDHPFLVMELVEGQTLQKLVADRKLTQPDSARIVRDVAQAIQYAHDLDVIHRDLKPGNILLTPDGVPKVADFGLAKLLSGDSNQTLTTNAIGTPAYMSPEQIEGNSENIGSATDVYGLGAILYYLLTSHTPFEGDTQQALFHQILTAEPKPPRQQDVNVPRDLFAICQKCLNKEPTARYPSASALADDLDHWLGGEPISVRPGNAWTASWKWMRKYPAAAALICVSMLSLSIIAIGAWTAMINLDRAYVRTINNEQQMSELIDGFFDPLIIDQSLSTAKRTELFQKMIEFYDRWLEDNRNSSFTLRLARTEYRRAYFANAIQPNTDRLPGFLNARETAFKFSIEQPDVIGFQDVMYESDIAIGDCYFQRGQYDDAIITLEQACVDLQALDELDAAPNGLRTVSIAQCKINLCAVFRAKGEFQKGVDSAHAAVDLLEKGKLKDDPYTIYNLARAHGNLALCLDQVGLFVDAEQSFRDSISTQEKLVSANPRNEDAKAHLCFQLINYAVFLKAQGRLSDSEAQISLASNKLRSLINEYPTDEGIASLYLKAVHFWGIVQQLLADVTPDSEQNPDIATDHELEIENANRNVIREINEAIQACQAIDYRDSTNIEFLHRLSDVYLDIGQYSQELGSHEDADNAFAHSIPVFEHLIPLASTNPDFQLNLMWAMIQRAICLIEQKEFGQAYRQYEDFENSKLIDHSRLKSHTKYKEFKSELQRKTQKLPEFDSIAK